MTDENIKEQDLDLNLEDDVHDTEDVDLDLDSTDDSDSDFDTDEETEGQEKEEDELNLDEFDLDENEKFVVDDYTSLTELGYDVTSKAFKDEAGVLLDEGFSPEQIAKLYKKFGAKPKEKKKPTPVEIKENLKRTLTRKQKSDYQKYNSFMKDVFGEGNKETVTGLMTDPYSIGIIEKIYDKVYGADTNNKVEPSERTPKTQPVTIEQAEQKLEQAQLSGMSEEKQEKLIKALAKGIKNEKDRALFVNSSFTYSAK